MLNHRFYTAFGGLLYAMAISDNRVQEEEIEEIHNITRQLIQTYLPNSSQELKNFNTLMAEYGFFNDLHAGLNKDQALKAFLDYYFQNKELFTPPIQELCINAITRIAEAYAGIVTEEKRLILTLKDAFKQQ